MNYWDEMKDHMTWEEYEKWHNETFPDQKKKIKEWDEKWKSMKFSLDEIKSHPQPTIESDVLIGNFDLDDIKD